MNLQTVQTLVLRAPRGPVALHQVLRIPDGAGRAALSLLAKHRPSFGLVGAPNDLGCSMGFSHAGLEALGLPQAYLRVFRRLAPAFTEGAVRRSVRVGDGGASAAQHWLPEFGQNQAHVLLSWHGADKVVRKEANALARNWGQAFGSPVAAPLEACRIGAPPGEIGEWMHFGYRDGISEVCIDDDEPRPDAPDCRRHLPGALLLGHVNDAGFNPFALSRAPEKVRAFFRDSSFGILRPMEQDLSAFEDELDRWQAQLAPLSNPAPSRDFIKAKLCGRWPNGRQLRPGDTVPQGSLVLDLNGDADGEGCPFGAHVRRMRAAPDRNGNLYLRPLQRRSFPFGSATWSQPRPTDRQRRGQVGHFFCANIEDQFEHLLGQWAARPPLGLSAADRAQDPLTGPHDDAGAALEVPLTGHRPQYLRGFRAWTTTLGTLYAWHPGRSAFEALLRDDFVPEDHDRPWL